MSAPLKLSTEQLRQLASALEELSETTVTTGVNFSSYGSLTAEIGDSYLAIRWDGETQLYVVDDRIGD